MKNYVIILGSGYHGDEREGELLLHGSLRPQLFGNASDAHNFSGLPEREFVVVSIPSLKRLLREAEAAERFEYGRKRLGLIQWLRLKWSGKVNGCFYCSVDHDRMQCKRCFKPFDLGFPGS